jgi:aminoglycoside phosphotransferase (APT) family kinase protein
MPAEGYPWRWSVCRWLEGEAATRERIAGVEDAATTLARFVAALHRIDPTGGSLAGAHSCHRGVPLAQRDPLVREAIAAMGPEFDASAVTAAWEEALDAPVWDAPPAWVHGEIRSSNLLVVRGRISTMIDFGCLGVGNWWARRSWRSLC